MSLIRVLFSVKKICLNFVAIVENATSVVPLSDCGFCGCVVKTIVHEVPKKMATFKLLRNYDRNLPCVMSKYIG